MTKKNTLFTIQPFTFIYDDSVANISMYTLIRYVGQLCQLNVDVVDVDVRHRFKKLVDVRNVMLEPTMSHNSQHVLPSRSHRHNSKIAGSSS